MNKKLWIDDIRAAPDATWDVAKNYWEAIDLLRVKDYVTVSFDHDIASFAQDREFTGYDILCKIEEAQVFGAKVPVDLYVHSANPIGRGRMQIVIDKIYQNWQRSFDSK